MKAAPRSVRALLLLPCATMLVSADVALAPGSWSHTGKVESAVIPGVPAFLARIAARMRDHKTCLTRDEVANTPHALLRQPHMECVAREFSVAGGRIAGAATCRSPKLDAPLTMRTSGSYTPTSYTVRTITTGSRKGKPMRIVTTGTGRRTGGC